MRSGVDGITGLLVGSGLVLWIALLAEAVLKKEAMGFGDVKFVGAIGAFTGWQGAVFAVFGGAVIGTLWFALALLWHGLFWPARSPHRRRRPRRRMRRRQENRMPPRPPGPGRLDSACRCRSARCSRPRGCFIFSRSHRWVDAYFARLAELV